MNPQEKAQLDQFLDGLVSAKSVNKLPDADQIIRRAVARQPDAAYLLVQRCMLLEQGLSQAKARIAELEQSQSPAQSFLEGAYQPGLSTRSAPQPAPTDGSSRPGAPIYGAPTYGAPAYGAPPPVGSGAGSFLGQAAATAAGVAGGAFLFEGLEHLFNHPQAGFGSAGFGGEGFLPGRDENVTINNFYEGQNDGRDDGISNDDGALDGDSSLDDVPDDDDAGFDDDSTDPGSSWT